MKPETITSDPGYFSPALKPNIRPLITQAKHALADVDFDTIVGTGMSGALFVPQLARSMGKHFVLVRKKNVPSHSPGRRLVGTLGRRWIFVDDFVGLGDTRRDVRRAVDEEVRRHEDVYEDNFETRYVGTYQYTRSRQGFLAEQ